MWSMFLPLVATAMIIFVAAIADRFMPVNPRITDADLEIATWAKSNLPPDDGAFR